MIASNNYFKYLAISICTQSSKVKIFAKLARALASGINYPISADNNLQSYE